jgi:hypothetical protein
VGGLLLLIGCNTFPLARTTSGPTAANIPTEVPGKEAILNYLNDNARRVQSVRVKELDIVAKEGMQSVGLRGDLVCAKPRNFRMRANSAMKQEADIGSNDQEFWFWVARNTPPHLYYCSYDDLARGVRVPFPFQPEWVMEALGIAETGPAENYKLVVKPGMLELVEETRSPQGAPVRKVTLLNRAPAQGTTPQVTAHILQDAQGREICSAHISEVQFDRVTGAILPRKVRLVCPAEKMELKLQLDDCAVNDPTVAQVSGRLFSRPALANVGTFNMARGLDGSPGPVRQIGAQRFQ